MAESKRQNSNSDELVSMEVLGSVSVIESQTRGEIDIQINTAKKHPRDIATFLRKAETWATINDEIAAGCFYKLKRKSRDGGTAFIEGPSVRLAEIVASAYGNMRIDARTVDEDDRFVYSQGVAWDLQENVAIRFEVRRRITTNTGARFNDDMIGVTANAASAIALRNSVFRVVPKAFWEPIFEKAKAVAAGTQEQLGQRRQKMLDYFVSKLGVDKEKVFKHLEIDGVESMTVTHVETLRGLATAIKEGDTTIDKEFYDKAEEGKMPTPRAKTDAKTDDSKSAPVVDKEIKPGVIPGVPGTVKPAVAEQPANETTDATKEPTLPLASTTAESEAKAEVEPVVQQQAEPSATETIPAEKPSPTESVTDIIDAITAESWSMDRQRVLKMIEKATDVNNKLAWIKALNRKKDSLVIK